MFRRALAVPRSLRLAVSQTRATSTLEERLRGMGRPAAPSRARYDASAEAEERAKSRTAERTTSHDYAYASRQEFSDWDLLTEENIRGFLMDYSNIDGAFMESVRSQYVRSDKLSERQVAAIGQRVIDSRSRQKKIVKFDPIAIKLLTLEETDWEKAKESRGEEKVAGDRVYMDSFREQLEEKGWLTPKQLRVCGSMMYWNFGFGKKESESPKADE